MHEDFYDEVKMVQRLEIEKQKVATLVKESHSLATGRHEVENGWGFHSTTLPDIPGLRVCV